MSTDGNSLNIPFLCCRIFRFFWPLHFFFFAAVSRILQKFCHYSIKSSCSAHAALFWSIKSWPISLAKVFHPVFSSRFLSCTESDCSHLNQKIQKPFLISLSNLASISWQCFASSCSISTFLNLPSEEVIVLWKQIMFQRTMWILNIAVSLTTKYH